MDIQEIREQGIGNGFHVSDAADGHRGGNRLWFGTCDTCGERVTNSIINGVWEHKIILTQRFRREGDIFPSSQSSRNVDYCPTSRGEVHNPTIIKEAS